VVDDLICFASPRDLSDDQVPYNHFQPIRDDEDEHDDRFEFAKDFHKHFELDEVQVEGEEDVVLQEQYVDLLRKLESLPHTDEETFLQNLSPEQLGLCLRSLPANRMGKW
jgi:hypothetical protein